MLQNVGKFYTSGGELMLMQWEKQLDLGIEVLDNEHKELIEHANVLFTAIKDGKSDDQVMKHLEFLAAYTLKHFESEEKFQKKIGYPDYEAHRKIHQEFKGVVNALLDDVRKNGLSASKKIEVNRMTIDWLRKHIGIEDKKIATFYHNQILNK